MPRTWMGGGGPLLVIGGAEDKLGSKTILNRFVKLAGGPAGKVVVLSTASSLGEEATAVYRELFHSLGVRDVRGLRPVTRREANDSACSEVLADATGVFMTGGNQSKLSAVVSGTRLGNAIANAHDRGAVVGGTSAGASALSRHMVSFGSEGTTPKHRMVHLAAGLGLLPGVIVDQHFAERNRVGRLLALVASSPSLLGLGIDEDTAAQVAPDGTFEVLGKGSVLVVDGTNVESNAFEARGSQPLMVSGAVLHTIPAGYRFSIAERRLVTALKVVRDDGASAPVTKRAARRIASEGTGAGSRKGSTS